MRACCSHFRGRPGQCCWLAGRGSTSKADRRGAQISRALSSTRAAAAVVRRGRAAPCPQAPPRVGSSGEAGREPKRVKHSHHASSSSPRDQTEPKTLLLLLPLMTAFWLLVGGGKRGLARMHGGAAPGPCAAVLGGRQLLLVADSCETGGRHSQTPARGLDPSYRQSREVQESNLLPGTRHRKAPFSLSTHEPQEYIELGSPPKED